MTQMSEQAVLTAMGLKGFRKGIEAVCALLVSMGYLDVERELSRRSIEEFEYFDGGDE